MRQVLLWLQVPESWVSILTQHVPVTKSLLLLCLFGLFCLFITPFFLTHRRDNYHALQLDEMPHKPLYISALNPSLSNLGQLHLNVTSDAALIDLILKNTQDDLDALGYYQRVFAQLYDNANNLRRIYEESVPDSMFRQVLDCVYLYELSYMRLGEALFGWLPSPAEVFGKLHPDQRYEPPKPILLEGQENKLFRDRLANWWYGPPKLVEPFSPFVSRPYDQVFVNYLDKFRGEGVGITMVLSNNMVKQALFFVRHLRVLNCTLPIELFYAGQANLAVQFQDLFRSIPGVRTHDLTTQFSEDILSLEDAALKPFAAIASQFRHVILTAPDVVFLQNPERILDDQVYSEYGMMYFKQHRPVPGEDEWLRNVLDRAQFRRLKDIHVSIETGVIVIDKHHHMSSLLSVAKLSEARIRKSLGQGDQRWDQAVFWLGYSVMQRSCAIAPYPPASISVGTCTNDTCDCNSKEIHSIFSGPLWFDSSLIHHWKSTADEMPTALNPYYPRVVNYQTETIQLPLLGLSNYAKSYVDHVCAPYPEAVNLHSTKLVLIERLNQLWNSINVECSRRFPNFFSLF
jgi:hypothetical protein